MLATSVHSRNGRHFFVSTTQILCNNEGIPGRPDVGGFSFELLPSRTSVPQVSLPASISGSRRIGRRLMRATAGVGLNSNRSQPSSRRLELKMHHVNCDHESDAGKRRYWQMG